MIRAYTKQMPQKRPRHFNQPKIPSAKVGRKISCNIKGEAHSQGILADAVSAGELVASCRSPSFTKNTCRRVES